MSNNLLKLAVSINTVIKVADFYAVFDGMCHELALLAEAGVILLDINGRVISIELAHAGFSIFNIKAGVLEQKQNERLKNIITPNANIDLKNVYKRALKSGEDEDCVCAVWPVSAVGGRIATLVMYKSGGAFNDEAMAAAGFCTAIAAVVIRQLKSQEDADEARRISVVKSAIASLSYSELTAALHIFNELKTDEGLIVASKVAEKTGITRSVIVNALRKLESAGVIESRSLGMKGTYIKVLNQILINELNKLRG